MSCIKVSYATKEEAGAALGRIINKKRHGVYYREERALYLCNRCGSYHLSSRFSNFPDNAPIYKIPDTAFDFIMKSEPEATIKETKEAKEFLIRVPGLLESYKKNHKFRFASIKVRSVIIWGLAFIFPGKFAITERDSGKVSGRVYHLFISVID